MEDVNQPMPDIAYVSLSNGVSIITKLVRPDDGPGIPLMEHPAMIIDTQGDGTNLAFTELFPFADPTELFPLPISHVLTVCHPREQMIDHYNRYVSKKTSGLEVPKKEGIFTG